MNTSSKSPCISVVIPSTSRNLPALLETALARQTFTPIEVIHIYDEQRKGAAWARNRGIETASGDIVACIDDDCVPPVHWLASIRDTMCRYNADVVGGTYREKDPFLRARRNRQRYPGKSGPDRQGQVGTGGNIAYRKDILDRVRNQFGSVFDESFRISQDWELIWRLRSIGARVVFLATPVQHQKLLTPVAYLRQQFFRGIGIARLDEVRNRIGSAAVTHRSLLWSDDGSAAWSILPKLFWYKGIGPFDWRSFTSVRQFLLFWLGEKVQSIGFLWAKIRKPKLHVHEQPG